MGHIFGLKFKYLLIRADHPNVNLQLIGKSNNIPGLKYFAELLGIMTQKCYQRELLLLRANVDIWSFYYLLQTHSCFHQKCFKFYLITFVSCINRFNFFFWQFYQSRCWLVKKAYLMTWYIFTDQHSATLSHLIWVKSQTQLRSFGEWTPGLAARSEGARTPRRAVFCQ